MSKVRNLHQAYFPGSVSTDLEVRYGKQLMSALQAMQKRMMILEALLLDMEQPVTPESDQRIAFADREGFDFIDPHDIVRCQADGNYTEIHLANGKVLYQSHTLKEIATKLPQHLFLRVHQSHLVNHQCISKYIRNGGHYILLDDGSKLPVARDRRVPFLKNMTQSKNN